MGVGVPGRRVAALGAALLAVVALSATLVADAGAAKLVGKDGKVYACYKAKGKSKGAVRLVAKKAKCKHGEKKISWNVTGPAGENGSSGENGSNGESGSNGATGETGTAGTKTLEKQVTTLTDKVTSLESVLNGVTNSDLTGLLSKLNGISGTQLQEAVSSVADVNALCAQTTALTEQTTELGAALEGITLLGVTLLELVVPQVTALSPFSC